MRKFDRMTQKKHIACALTFAAAMLGGSHNVMAAPTQPPAFAGPLMPVAVLGLEQTNLFVDRDGLWAKAPYYIPAYVRRYPFTFIEQPDRSAFSLGIDMACERLTRADGSAKSTQALFEDGKPSALMQDALRFCGALQNDHLATRAFAAALEDQKLLIEQQANAVLPNGQRYDLRGFRIIDAKALRDLPDEVALDWHKKGWLPLAYFLIASLDRWTDLLERTSSIDSKTAT